MFLNPGADILVGHGGQLSVILAQDYEPFEVPLPTEDQIESKRHKVDI